MKTIARNLNRGLMLRVNSPWQTVHFARILAVSSIGGRMAVAVRDTRTAADLRIPIDDAIDILDFDLDQEVTISPDAMGAESYHGKAIAWSVGMHIMHVTDDGQIFPGKIKSIADGLLEIEFPDSQSGWEKPATCYPS